MAILSRNRTTKVEHHLYDGDGTNIKLSFLFAEEGDPILGIDTSEGEVVSVSGDKETLIKLSQSILSICKAVYGD